MHIVFGTLLFNLKMLIKLLREVIIHPFTSPLYEKSVNCYPVLKLKTVKSGLLIRWD